MRQELMYGVHEWLLLYLEWKFMSVRDFGFHHPYILSSQKKAQTILNIMEVKNVDTAAYLNQDENNSKQDTKRAKTPQYWNQSITRSRTEKVNRCDSNELGQTDWDISCRNYCHIKL